ncbi:hypothetical protein SCUP515_10297 [Seiridium cupressi]
MQLLHDRILERIEAREYPKTTCPSEVARGMSSDELSSLGCADWCAAMDLVRQEAWSMSQRGLLDVTQKGEAITVDWLEKRIECTARGEEMHGLTSVIEYDVGRRRQS